MQAGYYGTGRRKSAIARVWVREGENQGRIMINGVEFKDYLCRPVLEHVVRAPLEIAQMMERFDIHCTAKGGGISGQAGAVRLGIARALLEYDPTLRPALKDAGLLTRDARIKERKKYGRKKARRGFQFVKR